MISPRMVGRAILFCANLLLNFGLMAIIVGGVWVLASSIVAEWSAMTLGVRTVLIGGCMVLSVIVLGAVLYVLDQLVMTWEEFRR